VERRFRTGGQGRVPHRAFVCHGLVGEQGAIARDLLHATGSLPARRLPQTGRHHRGVFSGVACGWTKAEKTGASSGEGEGATWLESHRCLGQTKPARQTEAPVCARTVLRRSPSSFRLPLAVRRVLALTARVLRENHIAMAVAFTSEIKSSPRLPIPSRPRVVDLAAERCDGEDEQSSKLCAGCFATAHLCMQLDVRQRHHTMRD